MRRRNTGFALKNKGEGRKRADFLGRAGRRAAALAVLLVVAVGCEETVVDRVCPAVCQRLGGTRTNCSHVPANACGCLFPAPPLHIAFADGGAK